MSALELDLINQILFINVKLTSAINVQKLTIHIQRGTVFNKMTGSTHKQKTVVAMSRLSLLTYKYLYSSHELQKAQGGRQTLQQHSPNNPPFGLFCQCQ